jgi:hypothetical protein
MGAPRSIFNINGKYIKLAVASGGNKLRKYFAPETPAYREFAKIF